MASPEPRVDDLTFLERLAIAHREADTPEKRVGLNVMFAELERRQPGTAAGVRRSLDHLRAGPSDGDFGRAQDAED